MSASISKLTPSSLAALLCARICHDLVSPVGALSTAIEVLDDDSNADMHDDAMDLVRLSARQAGAKLRYLRLAFGAGGSAPGIIAMDEIKTLVDGMFGEGKATISWADGSDGIDKNSARLLLNLVMLAVQSIPRGGDLAIGASNSGAATQLSLVATGPRARLDQAIEKTLAGKAPEDGFDGRTIQPFYAGMMTREMSGTVTAAIVEETVTFTASIPDSPAP